MLTVNRGMFDFTITELYYVREYNSFILGLCNRLPLVVMQFSAFATHSELSTSSIFLEQQYNQGCYIVNKASLITGTFFYILYA
jgi:hypothetical protein